MYDFGNTSGHGNSIHFGDMSVFDGLTAYTFAFWMKLNIANVGSDPIIWQKYDGTNGWAVRIDTDEKLYILHGASASSKSGLVMDTSTHHVVVTWTGTVLKILVDGAEFLNTSFSTSPGSTTTNVRIGTNDAGTLGFPGRVGQLMAWNVALSDQDAQGVYAGSLPRPESMIFWTRAWEDPDYNLFAQEQGTKTGTVTIVEDAFNSWAYPIKARRPNVKPTPPAENLSLLSTSMRTELSKTNPQVYPALELDLPGGTKLYSSEGLESAARGFYAPRVLHWGTIDRRINEQEPNLELMEVEVTLADADKEIVKIVEGSSGHLVKNSAARIYLISPNVPNADAFLAFSGRIDSFGQSRPLEWTLLLRPNDLPLRRFTPKVAITPADWPDASPDVYGQYAPLIYGVHDSNGVSDAGMVPTYYVDTKNFKMLLSHGLIKNIRAVYSGGTKLSTTAWARQNVTVNGKSFTLIDLTSDPGTAKITADVEGYEGTGDGSGAMLAGSDQIKHFLVNFVWGDYQGGNWLADSTAPVDLTWFQRAQVIIDRLGFESSIHIAGTQRKGIDVLNDWLKSMNFRAFWTFAGKIAIRFIDFRQPTAIYLDSPWLREFDEMGSFQTRVEGFLQVDRVQVQYLPDAAGGGRFNQTLEVRDLSQTEEAVLSMQLPQSAARVV
jgi:hypothetical protein